MTDIAVLAAALLSFSTAVAGASHEYRVTADTELGRLEIVARFGAAVTAISVRSRTAEQFLVEARDCDSGKRVETRGRNMLLANEGIRCLKYSVDLAKAVSMERRNEYLHGANVVVSPTVWMWRPRLGADDEIIVEFLLPEDIGVSVPWQPIHANENSYRLTASPQSGSAVSIFGRFDSFVANVANADLRIDVLRSKEQTNTSAIVDWVRDTALNITQAYGRFPNPDTRIVVFPVDKTHGDSPVRFGRVVRDGGETIELMIDPAQPMQAFYENWTATHEFSHLLLPYLQKEQQWISEGFAQYYQNIFLARAGRYTQRYAWQKLYDGLERGRESAPELSPNDAAIREERDTRMKIYWSGAALALMADVELRRRSNGVETLDGVLDQFQHCCLPSQRTWSGVELFTKFDSFLDEPLFLSLYWRYADAVGFPALGSLLEQLGVASEDGEVNLRNDAQLVRVRMALTGRNADATEHDSPPRDR